MTPLCVLPFRTKYFLLDLFFGNTLGRPLQWQLSLAADPAVQFGAIFNVDRVAKVGSLGA